MHYIMVMIVGIRLYSNQWYPSILVFAETHPTLSVIAYLVMVTWTIFPSAFHEALAGRGRDTYICVEGNSLHNRF